MRELEYNANFSLGRKHPTINKVRIIDDKTNFPISWLNSQDYCEYSIYLENFQGIRVDDTEAMKRGTAIHNKLEDDFKREAEVMSLDEIIERSHDEEIISREFQVISPEYGIRGFIDEIWLSPDRVVIIDDKPGSRAFNSMKHQVYAYCLAYREQMNESRPLVAALRTRGTDNIFWQHAFDKECEDKIVGIIEHMQRLISGEDFFSSTDNPNKCGACRFNKVCPNSRV